MMQLMSGISGTPVTPKIINELNVQYILKTEMWLDEYIIRAQIASATGVQSFLAKYNALTKSEKIDFLLRAEVCEVLTSLYNGITPDRASINIQIESMICIIDERVGRTHIEWTPEVRPEIVINDIVMLRGIEIDFGTPRAQRINHESSVSHLQPSPIDNGERHKVLRQLDNALREIQHTSNTYYALIEAYARVIIIRKNSMDMIASEQVSDAIGEISLLNPLHSLFSNQMLMETLIHESTHNYLSTFERLEFPFIMRGSEYRHNIRPTSLWSGRPIKSEPFIHAVFVYFSLFNFVKLQLDKSKKSAESATIVNALQSNLNRLASGFLYPGKISHYVSYACLIDPQVRICLDNMQAIVRSHVEHMARDSLAYV